MNRRGDWIQIFLILFFVLLILITLGLLFVEKDTLQDKRPEWDVDLANIRTQAILVSAMRLPVDVDINEDGIVDQGSLAELITLNREQMDDELKHNLISAFIGDHYYRITIEYPEREIQVQNVTLVWQIETEHLGESTMILPAGIKVTLEMTGISKSDERKKYERTLRESRERSGGGLGA